MLARKLAVLLFPAVSSIVLFACTDPAPSTPDTNEASASIATPASSCYDQCAAYSGDACVLTCGATPAECRAATKVCYDSCDRGVGPWLPC